MIPMSNYELEKILKQKVALERKTTVEIISLLEEVEARKLYLQRGFGSLIEYCTKELGYSESSAYRRTQAMRVAKELPEIKKSIQSGKLNLVTIAKAQTVFKQREKEAQKFSTSEKAAILQSLETKSTRQAEKVLLEFLPQADIPREKIKEISADKTQVTTILSEDLVQKLNKIKNQFSHQSSNPNYSELIELMADYILKKTQCNTSAENRRAKVFRRAHNQCEFVDPISKKRCTSKFQLQVEHIIPRAKGGTNDLQNLEVLCAPHNRFRAVQHFGQEHMSLYLN